MTQAQTARPRWLIVVPEIPRADHAGGDRRLLEILQALAGQCELFLVSIAERRHDDPPYEAILRSLQVRVLNRGVRAATQVLVRYSFDAVFFEFFHTAEYLLDSVRALQPTALVIVDSVDVHYLREREAVRLGTLDAAVASSTEERELAAYRRADITIVVSDTELAVLREQGVGSVAIIPIIVTVTKRVERNRDAELLFIGAFNHHPNRLAVEWFHGLVWPLVRQRVPSAQWVIAGSNAPAGVRALHGSDNIRVVGFVPTTAPLLESAQISIAPLTYGGGMKVKVCEALAAGLPVVTTKWGAQGLEAGINTAFLVADNPSDFAHAVVQLLTDGGARAALSVGGQELAATTCTMAAATGALHEIQRQSTGRRGRMWPAFRMRSFARYAAGRAIDRLLIRVGFRHESAA